MATTKKGIAQHTPGPWEFRFYSKGCTIVSTHNAPGRSVRDALKGVSVRVDAEINDDQSNAHEASPDARLISAAPELLDACRDALDTLEMEGVADGDTADKLRKAIAKATGA